MDRYLLEANIRADASSRFHKDNRWGVFPSFSAGWRINQEGFMQDINWINNLKVRASWGQLGNINMIISLLINKGVTITLRMSLFQVS